MTDNVTRLSDHFEKTDKPSGPFGDRILPRNGRYNISMPAVSQETHDKYKDCARDLLTDETAGPMATRNQLILHFTHLLATHVPEFLDSYLDRMQSKPGSFGTPLIIMTIGNGQNIIKIGSAATNRAPICAPEEENSSLTVLTYEMPVDDGRGFNHEDCYSKRAIDNEFLESRDITDIANLLALIFAASEESRKHYPQARSPLSEVDENAQTHYTPWVPQ
jgi:hypothetical protein